MEKYAVDCRCPKCKEGILLKNGGNGKEWECDLCHQVSTKNKEKEKKDNAVNS